jgi:hypothetical protein
MDGCIAKRLKLLIWLDTTCKQKKRPKWEGRIEAGSRKKKGEEEGVYLFPPTLRSIF